MNVAKYSNNKYLNNVLMFLAATNMLTFIIKKKYDTLIFFIAVSILTAHYTTSMSIILVVSLITSNLFNTLEYQKEGLKDKKASDDEDSGEGTKNDAEDSDDSGEGTKNDAEDSDSGEGTKNDAEDSDNESGNESGNESDEDKKEVDADEEDRIKNKNSNNSLGFGKLKNTDKSSTDDDSSVGNNIDYSATLQDAYKNLQGLLGKDGIKGLTSQTNKLLGQQQNLMTSLKNMGPIIDDAQNTLKGFNLAGVTKLFDRQKTTTNKTNNI
jgi:hypothetical protein